MINRDEVEKVINERKNLNPDDPRIMDRWEKLTSFFIQSEEDTIEYLNQCSLEDIYWISEVFEDISEQFKSPRFIECIEKLSEKYPELDLYWDIWYAKQRLL